MDIIAYISGKIKNDINFTVFIISGSLTVEWQAIDSYATYCDETKADAMYCTYSFHIVFERLYFVVLAEKKNTTTTHTQKHILKSAAKEEEEEEGGGKKLSLERCKVKQQLCISASNKYLSMGFMTATSKSTIIRFGYISTL